jgi:hypothetical protein
MNDSNDEVLSAEEQARLYRERESASGADCPPSEMSLVPDTDPVVPAEKCGEDGEPIVETFLAPNPIPPAAAPPDLLPAPLAVLSRARSVACPPGQVAVAGEDPSMLAPGADVQLVYLDEIENELGERIAQQELFRLADYTDSLQAHVASNLVAAIDSENFATFDATIVSITKTSTTIAALTREALVVAQARADQIAQTIALAGVVCGWHNQALWVVCHHSAPGYAFVLSDPGAVEKVHVAAGLFSSTVSQADANAQAALSAALGLSCLVANEEQDVSCSDLDGAVSESLPLAWPTGWVKASSPRNAAIGSEVVTLDAQGVGTWTVSRWDQVESTTETIELGALNGQEFLQPNQVGSPARRRLRTRSIVEAGDPRAAAADLATANAIARNLALAALDCFVPNRPRVISCITPTYGSPEVAARRVARGLTANNAGRTTMFEELRGGDPNVYAGPVYHRTNVGVANYGTPTEQVDTKQAFDVYVWPGYFSGSTEAEVSAVAGNYGASLLHCVWMSPAHNCQCVGNSDLLAASGPGQWSAKFSSSLLVGGVRLSSNSLNTLPRGFAVSTTYPNKAADTNYNDMPLSWPGLPAICQAELDCLFTACKVVCCEPKPDDREYKVNGEPNYVTYGSAPSQGKAASAQDQQAFMQAWNQQRAASSSAGCAGYFGADDCGNGGVPSYGNPNSLAATGPSNGAYGAPARFKYGGLLQWGRQWAEAPAAPPGAPSSELKLIGEVKNCHKGATPQTPNVWGIFSCAEGKAEGPTPAGLGEQARQAALARLDCTHVSWPRHLTKCPEPNQKAFGPPVNLNMVVEGGSSREANEQAENLVLQALACRDTHSFMLTFRGGGGGGGATLELPAPAVVNSGSSACIPPGLNEATLYQEDCSTKVKPGDIGADRSSHVFIIVKCCKNTRERPKDPPEKRLILKLVPDSKIDGEIKALGQQLGNLGLPSGRKALETLRKTDPNVWYIGSFSVADLGNGKGNWAADRLVVQAHSGPIVIDQSCCDDSDDRWELVAEDSERPERVKLRAPMVLEGVTALADKLEITNDPVTLRANAWLVLEVDDVKASPYKFTFKIVNGGLNGPDPAVYEFQAAEPRALTKARLPLYRITSEEGDEGAVPVADGLYAIRYIGKGIMVLISHMVFIPDTFRTRAVPRLLPL